MNDLQRAISAFVSADVEAFTGLPAGLRLADLTGVLAFDPDDRRHGDAGDPSRTRLWVPAETAVYHSGLRLWLDDDGEHVVLLEGVHPMDAAGEPLQAPELGPPEGVFDAVLGPFHVTDAERVYADRGLAVQVYAETGVLVGVLGFTPTTVDDFQRRLQPHREPIQPFPQPVVR